MILYAYGLVEQIYCTKMATSAKFESTNNLKPMKKVLMLALQFQFKCETHPTVKILSLKCL